MIKILAVTFGTLVALACLLFSANMWGMGQKFSPYEHPFFPKESKLLVIGCDSIESCKEVQTDVQNSSEGKQALALAVAVHTSSDAVIFVASDEDSKNFMLKKRAQQNHSPQERILLGSNIYDYPFADIQKEIPTAIELKRLTEAVDAQWMLNVEDNVLDIHARVAAIFPEVKWDKKLLATSQILVVLTALKELKPGWLYGTSQPDIMRFLVFESLYILPSVSFKGDVFIAPFKFQKRIAFTENTLAEVRRRFKKVLLGPLENSSEVAEAQRLNADGMIFTNLKDYHSFSVTK